MLPRLAFAAIAVLLAQPLAAQVYQWRDADGKLHFTDTPPPQSRAVESENLQVNSMNSLPPKPPEPAVDPEAQKPSPTPAQLQQKGLQQCSTAIARMPTLINETQKLGRDAVRKQKITQNQLDKAMFKMDDFYKGLKRNERECVSEYVASEKSRVSIDCLADTQDVLTFGQCMQFAEWAETFR
ncbi:hypothetical protein Pres01_20200 [Metapseudomonas resinovorans]|uniref:DUF4124 domain-containing protein n=1 Tax=Metapseudomonas resinovorans TaxID=53412 RepID=UPI000985EC82|nr:DUF4124 domain-containing protein [Pseudomonas resinovorans]GLZ85969.1 hypothetical protein Pres01_20200 [Pseudomonas resinovorans]